MMVKVENAIKRINEMESILDEALRRMDNAEEAPQDFLEYQTEIKEGLEGQKGKVPGIVEIKATRECAFNGDDDQKVQTLKYQEGEMLSTFLRLKVADYLPYTDGLTVWIVYMGSNEDQPTAERENDAKKVAFIHKIENRCSKVEIRGGDKAVSSFGVNELYCAIYR